MMGWRPGEVRAHAVPEFLAAFDGYLEFHSASSVPQVEPATRDQLEELMRQYPD
jgi:hypothetical protein